MGILTDVVIADPSKAKAACEDINSKAFTWEATPGLSVQMLAALRCVLEKRRFSKKLMKELAEGFPLLCQAHDGGVIAKKIPDELVVSLYEMEKTSIPEIATSWLGTKCPLWEESPRQIKNLLPPDPTIGIFDVETLEKLLQILRELSSKAIRRKKSLLLRISV